MSPVRARLSARGALLVGLAWSHGRVLRVYLDQNKWIDLAKAAHGTPGGERYEDVLALARAAVGNGSVSFPLDTSRYMETAKRTDWRSRQELVATMAELSRFHAVAPQQAVLPAELDLALQAICGRPETPRTAQVFGVGADHAFGGGIDVGRILSLHEGLPLPAGVRSQIEAEMRAAAEHALLLGPAPDDPAGAEHRRLMALMTQDAEFAAGRAALAARLTEQGYDKKERLDRAMLASQLQDILRPVVEALVHADIEPDSFFDTLGRDGLTAFLRDLPSRAVTIDLLRDKHAQGEQAWDPNDLNDVVSLPIAAVYCDVVVTEKQWKNRMLRAKVDRRYGTVLLSDLTLLAPVLSEATRTS